MTTCKGQRMIKKTATYFMGYRLLIDSGVTLKPRWYDLPRLLGLRKRTKTYATPKDSVLLSNENRFMTVRDEDYDALLNSPDFPRPEARDNLAQLG